jgi:hypothetical protein
MTQEILVITETEQLVVDQPGPEQLVAPAPPVVEILETATQGPPGPQGASGLLEATYAAGGVVSGHMAVVVQSDGTVVHADCTNAAHLGALAGISMNAAAQGDDVTVRAATTIDHSGWAFTPYAPVYLGLDGALVQSVPPGALFTQVVGWARSATKLLVSLQPPITLAS